MNAPAEPGGAGGILLRHEGAVAWITLERPDRLNAFAGTMRDDLHDALTAAAEEEATRVIVVTGAGRAFCAGADVDIMQGLLEEDDERRFAELVEAGMRVVKKIRSVPQLVVAAVNGVAAGAGASLAVACDLRIASAEAQIGFTFNRIGLHPDWGATYHLPRLIGTGRAADLIYSGRMVKAEEARGLGIFERVVPADTFTAEVREWVGELAAKPPLAVQAAKQTLRDSLPGDLTVALQAEADAQLRCFRSSDVREGISAFRERRKATFRGR